MRFLGPVFVAGLVAAGWSSAAAAPASLKPAAASATPASAAAVSPASAAPMTTAPSSKEEIDAGIARAVDLRVSKRYDEALTQLDRVSERISRSSAADPSIPESRAELGYQRGLVLEEAGRLPEAADAFEAVAKDYPYAGASGHARLSLAAVQQKLGKADLAAETLKSVLRENPRLASEALFGLAALEESRGRQLEAARAYRNVVRNFPTAPEATAAKKALDGICGKLLEVRSSSTEMDEIVGRGDCLMDANRAPEAEALYNAALKRKLSLEDRVGLLMALGQAMDAQEHTAAAERVYRKVVKLIPGTPDAAYAQMTIVQGFLDRGKLSDAAKELERIVKDYPGTPAQVQAQFEAGSVYEAMRDPRKAEEAYRKTVELAPQSPWGIEAQQCLVRLVERKP